MRNKRLIVLLSIVVVLVLAIVACGATFLVRDVDAYSYYGCAVDGTDYDSMVIDAAGIEKNSSMFFIDESEIKNRVENAYANIGVVNVERKFPDRVSVNYVVYERTFQYVNNGKTYYCYSSGKIGGEGARSDCFTVKPKGVTATGTGAYFQGAEGYDRKIVDAFIEFMRSRGLTDVQIAGQINFIDLTREGYIYIRTTGGCSIELRGSADEFARMLERGWNLYVDTDPNSPVTSRVSGLISVWMYRGDGQADVRSSYMAAGAEIGVTEQGEKKYYSDESYYVEHYVAGR